MEPAKATPDSTPNPVPRMHQPPRVISIEEAIQKKFADDDEIVLVSVEGKDVGISLGTLAREPDSVISVKALSWLNAGIEAGFYQDSNLDSRFNQLVVPIECESAVFAEICEYLTNRDKWHPPKDSLLCSRVVQSAKRLGVKSIENYIEERARDSPNIVYNYLSVTCSTRLGKFYIPLFARSMYLDIADITELTEHFEIPIGDVATQHKIISAPYRYQYRIINVTERGEMRTFHYHVV